MGSAGTMSENRYDINGVIHYLVFELLWQGNVKKVLDTKPSIYTKGFKTPKISKENQMHKILLVEDDQVIRQQVGKMLSEWGIWSGSGRRLYGSFESICSVGASSGPHGYWFALV